MKEGRLKEYFKLIRIYLIGSSGIPAVIGALSLKGYSLEISTFLILSYNIKEN